jgi:excisionase family DNA binding protein
MSEARMTTQQAADFIGIRLSTLYAWTSEGRIPFYRMSARRLRFDRAELEAWIQQRRVPERVGA